MPCEEVLHDQLYIHDEGQPRYIIQETVPDLTDYERTHELGKRAVIYMQLDEGKVYRSGARFVRSEESFKEAFSLYA